MKLVCLLMNFKKKVNMINSPMVSDDIGEKLCSMLPELKVMAIVRTLIFMTRNINIPIPQNPIGESFQWRDWFQKLSNVVFGTMATQDSNNIAVTGGSLAIGSSPAVSGSGVTTTMTGQGAVINNDGSFAIGNSASNIVSDGSNVYMHGFVGHNNTNLTTVFIPATGILTPTAMSFTISEPSVVVVGTSGTVHLLITNGSAFTPPSWGLITLNIGLVIVSGTQYILPGSTYGFPLEWSYAPGYQNSSGSYIYQWHNIFSFSFALSLPTGTYRLQQTGSNIFYNSSGAAYTPSQSINYYVDSLNWWYTVNA